MNVVICTGEYYESFEDLGPRLPIESTVLLPALLINFVLMVRISLKRKQHAIQDQGQVGPLPMSPSPQNLENLAFNFTYLTITSFGFYSVTKMNKSVKELIRTLNLPNALLKDAL